jgi:hypothetical protein
MSMIPIPTQTKEREREREIELVELFSVRRVALWTKRFPLAVLPQLVIDEITRV